MPNLNSVYLPAYFNTSNVALPGEDNTAPTTKWLNPVWDRWFDAVSNANGGQMPSFARKGGAMKLPTSIQSLDLGGGR